MKKEEFKNILLAVAVVAGIFGSLFLFGQYAFTDTNKDNLASDDLLLKVEVGLGRTPWHDLVDAFNVNFDRLRELTCSEPVPTRYAVGDMLTPENLNANFAVIIQSLERGGCKK